MLTASVNPVFDTGRRQMSPGLHVMLNLVEYPGVSNGRSANHDPIHAMSVTIFNCFFRRIDIPVSKYGNCNSWVFLDFANQGPISLTLIHLHSGSSVHGQRLDADILCSF